MCDDVDTGLPARHTLANEIVSKINESNCAAKSPSRFQKLNVGAAEIVELDTGSNPNRGSINVEEFG